MKQQVTRDITLNFDLSEYLIAHPEVFQRYSEENFVIFEENNNALNKRTETLLARLLKRGEGVVRATRKNTKYNKWVFEVAHNGEI